MSLTSKMLNDPLKALSDRLTYECFCIVPHAIKSNSTIARKLQNLMYNSNQARQGRDSNMQQNYIKRSKEHRDIGHTQYNMYIGIIELCMC